MSKQTTNISGSDHIVDFILLLLTSTLCGAEYSVVSFCCKTQTRNMDVRSNCDCGRAEWKWKVDGLTFRVLFTWFSSLRTSCNFLIFSSLEAAEPKEQQHTATRNRTTSFIFSESEERSPKVRFTGSVDCCVAYLLLCIPEDKGKPLEETWKRAETWVWVTKFSFPLAVTTTWCESGVKRRVRGAYRRVRARETQSSRQEATGRRHFPFSLWIIA